MDGMYMSHKEVPYGWVLWAAAAGRWLLRTFGVNPGIRNPHAAALDPALAASPVGAEPHVARPAGNPAAPGSPASTFTSTPGGLRSGSRSRS
jgi:hypothetical protein